MVSAGVVNVFDATQGNVRRDKVRVTVDECRPLLVLRHGNRATAEAFDSLVGIVTLALEDPGQSVVSLLNLTNNDGLELTAGGFEVEVGLTLSVIDPAVKFEICKLTLCR